MSKINCQATHFDKAKTKQANMRVDLWIRVFIYDTSDESAFNNITDKNNGQYGVHKNNRYRTSEHDVY